MDEGALTLSSSAAPEDRSRLGKVKISRRTAMSGKAAQRLLVDSARNGSCHGDWGIDSAAATSLTTR
jgi:hypothetical protein